MRRPKTRPRALFDARAATKRGSEIWVFTRRVRRERGQFPSITGRAALFDRASNGGADRLDLVFSIRRRARRRRLSRSRPAPAAGTIARVRRTRLRVR